ncbi:karyogamy protein [Aureobasidium namibiae CBS 147.97]|uniref:Karyogamy protein n=1 Tax=Aureobasidium namibiae CBS 147.97 TaxID=1043004 RepID=A0A074WGH2_9PEZI|nr:karyogamy protein [Aureobasidium namibiae CBS 147.97]KEQ72160.1 karyogamy protein [Aureobasidium namibiae CBS 147.97]
MPDRYSFSPNRSSQSTLTPPDSSDRPEDYDSLSGATDLEAYYNSDNDYTSHLSRAASISSRYSIYSLSRVSFASQLAQLSSIQLPDATSLSARISCMPTSASAANALKDSSDQIRRWIRNAHAVLDGLDAEDDVEWAAAGGREGLDHVDRAIGRFDKVVKLYILSVEELHLRHDIATLPRDQVQANSDDMDLVIKEWQKIKDSLAGVKEQVEIAMEWEELSNSVGTGIAHELDDLAGLVFEMEEQRHLSVTSSSADAAQHVDLDELKHIVDEKAGTSKVAPNPRLSLPAPFSPTSTLQTTPTIGNMEDNLLALFARMQPLRASLDFLPMRLSVFHCRGNSVFPTACLHLEGRRDSLEAQWKKLEADAEALRRELGEDRWLLVFRNAGRQALKMCQSVSRSVQKLATALDHDEQRTDTAALAKKVESYEAKKNHYGTAIERVLAIIDRGVLDRLTVNGEILGLQSDMKRKWASIQAEMRELDSRLLGVNLDVRNQQLRDSVSTIVSSEHSMTSSFMDTPRSSSASSVSRPDMTPRRESRFTRFVSAIPRRTPQSKPKDYKSSLNHKTSRGNLASGGATHTPYTPPPPVDPLIRQFKAPENKPRWNLATNTRSTSLQSLHPASSEPSTNRRVTLPHRPTTPHSTGSKIPTPSSFSRSTNSPVPYTPATPSRRLVSTPSSSPLTPRANSQLAYRSVSSNAKPRSTSFSLLPGGNPLRAPSSLRKTSYLSPTLDNHDENEDYANADRLAPGRQIRAASALGSAGAERKTSGNLFGFSRTKQGRSGSRLDTAASAGAVGE